MRGARTGWAAAVVAAVGLGGCGNGDGGKIALAPAWTTLSAPITRDQFGHNSVWARDGLGLWSDTAAAPVPGILAEVQALAPGLIRFPGGTRAMRYHFADAIGPPATRKPECDPFKGTFDTTSYGPEELLQLSATLGVDVSWVAPWVDGTPEETGALAAYLAGDATSSVTIGSDVNGVDWGAASTWAGKRKQAAPYTQVRFLEVGNEPYLGLGAGPPTSCDRPSQFVQDERWAAGMRIATTAKDYAAQLVKTAALVRSVAPSLRIGAAATSQYDGTSDAMTAVGDVDARAGGDAWNARLVSDAKPAFDFFVLHPYDFSTDDDARLHLADRLRKTIHDLRAAAPDKGVAVTEFGFLFGGGTLLNALVTADVTRVAIEEKLELSVRHILVEDEPNGPFADSAAIAAPSGARSPGYYAAQLVATSLAGNAVALPGLSDGKLVADGSLVALATSDGDAVAVLLVDRRLADSAPARVVRLTLPRAGMTADSTTLSGASLDATSTSVFKQPLVTDGTSVDLSVPPHSVVVLTARSR